MARGPPASGAWAASAARGAHRLYRERGQAAVRQLVLKENDFAEPKDRVALLQQVVVNGALLHAVALWAPLELRKRAVAPASACGHGARDRGEALPHQLPLAATDDGAHVMVREGPVNGLAVLGDLLAAAAAHGSHGPCEARC